MSAYQRVCLRNFDLKKSSFRIQKATSHNDKLAPGLAVQPQDCISLWFKTQSKDRGTIVRNTELCLKLYASYNCRHDLKFISCSYSYYTFSVNNRSYFTHLRS